MNSNSISGPPHALHRVWGLYRYAVPESVGIVRRHGWRELLRRRGWKFFAVIVAYYVVRDTLLYIVLPLCVARGLF